MFSIVAFRRHGYIIYRRGRGAARTFVVGLYKRMTIVREPNSMLELSQLLFVQRLTKRT